jgi:DNA helicase MCM8
VDGKYSTPTRCEDMKCRSTKFSLVRKVANFCDVQELRIQEVREEFCEDLETGDGGMGHGDGNRESGRAPRHMEVEVSNDLVDQCHAGDSIVVVGVVRAVNSALASGRGGKRAEETSTYKLYVVAHSIVNLTADDTVRGGQGTEDLQSGNEQGQNRRQKTSASASGIDWSDQQLQQLNNIAHADHLMYSIPTRQAFPFDLLVRSLCPSIIGNDLVKAGMILCLLGGTPPQVSGLEAQSGMTIRSNSHCLIVGDPGMGKSQMLLSANQVASRSVYVGGNTASSTGLTVSLTKESGGDMGIEAGALVLADRGICCLDELDKMPKAHQDGKLDFCYIMSIWLQP